VIKQVSPLGVMTIAAIAAVVLAGAGSAASAQQRIVKSPRSHSIVGSHQDRWKNLYNSQQPVGSYQDDWKNNGNDSLNADPFQSGPDPDFCIECTWPEGSPTYHGSNGG
jgi:hypothetical protein